MGVCGLCLYSFDPPCFGTHEHFAVTSFIASVQGGPSWQHTHTTIDPDWPCLSKRPDMTHSIELSAVAMAQCSC